MARVVVDGKEIELNDGERLLTALIEKDIYVPNLCCLKEMDKSPASCRLCFVEIEGEKDPVLSCTVYVKEGMVISTATERVRRLQKTAFELLLSVHRIECRECPANRKCELQKIAKFLKVPLKQKRIEYLDRETAEDEGHPFLRYDPYKCVMCGRCTYICRKTQGKLFLSFAGRGLKMTISFFGESDPEKVPCNTCYACVDICPVAALIKRDG